MATPPPLPSCDRKPWWLSTKKIVDKYVKEARSLVPTRDEPGDATAALRLLEAALGLSPRCEAAMELKARCLLHLRRYKEVAFMLRDYIPSYTRKMAADDEEGDASSTGSASETSSSSQPLNRERVKLLRRTVSGGGVEGGAPAGDGFRCFSVADLKSKVMGGLFKACEKEGQWRYAVLGQACCHLGLMEDALALLQTGKRLASAAFRRRSNSLSDDSFSSFHIRLPFPESSSPDRTPAPHHHHHHLLTESESTNHLLAQIKILLRRRAAALAALDAGLYSESIRHFSKILDGRRPAAPHPFLAECYLHRSAAYRSSGRIAESIADCNKTLALDPSSVPALASRAALFELIGSLTDAVHDLEHAKLLLNSSLRDRRPPDPSKPSAVRYREIPGRLCQLTAQIQRLKNRIANGEIGYVDYFALLGVRRGCSKPELDRAHLLLVLRHRPDRALGFVDRCEFNGDEEEKDSARERARMSCVSLYRLIQKGYSSVSNSIKEEAVAEKQRRKAAVALQETAAAAAAVAASSQSQAQQQQKQGGGDDLDLEMELQAAVAAQIVSSSSGSGSCSSPGSDLGRKYQGAFCRDLAVVGSLLSQAGFNRPLSVKYEALSC